MKCLFVLCLSLALLGPGATRSVTIQTVAGSNAPFTLIKVDESDATAPLRLYVERAIDDGKRIALAGHPTWLARMRPTSAHAWPATNTVVLDATDTLGILGFDAVDDDARERMLRAWAWPADTAPEEPAPLRHAAPLAPSGRQHVEFNMVVASPSIACRQLTRTLAIALFGTPTPLPDQRRALRKEARRWCQYGNISAHSAEPAQFTIEPFRRADEILLSLVTEWALLRHEDSADAARTTYLFWTRTAGEGAGIGFTRRHGTDA